MVIRRGIALVILARLSSTANSSVYPLLILRVRFSLCPFVAHRCIRANQVCLASIGNAINQTQSIYDAGYCFATSQTIASEKERAIRLSICVATTRPRFFAVLSDLCFGSNGITFWRNACAWWRIIRQHFARICLNSPTSRYRKMAIFASCVFWRNMQKAKKKKKKRRAGKSSTNEWKLCYRTQCSVLEFA